MSEDRHFEVEFSVTGSMFAEFDAESEEEAREIARDYLGSTGDVEGADIYLEAVREYRNGELVQL